MNPIYIYPTIAILALQYVDTVYNAHRVSRHGYDEEAPTWDFANSIFFTTTMLTSIGYGYVVPVTFGGRLFGVIYCLIGKELWAR